MIKPIRSILLSVILLLHMVGCGKQQQQPPNRVEVSGMVTFDGKPLPAGTIRFVSESDANVRPSFPIDQGKYSSKRGPIGKCKVSVETSSLLLGNKAAYVEIPEAYENAETSGFTAELKPGDNSNVDFALEKD